MGRLKKPAHERRDAELRVYITRGLYKQIKTAASSSGKDMTVWVRETLAAVLKLSA